MAVSPRPDPAPRARIDNLRVIWRMAARYPAHIAAALAGMLVAALATLAIPSSFKLIIDRGFAAGGSGDVGRWFQYLLLLVIVMAIATAVRFYFVSWIGERVVADLRIAVQTNLLRLSPSFFEENRPSEIASRMTSDTTIIEQLVGSTISVAVRNTVIGVGGILYLFTLSPKLTGMMVLGIPLIILPIVLLGRRVRQVSRASQDRVADVGAMVSEVLGAMKIVQAFGQQRRESARFTDAVERVLATAKRRIALRAVMTAIVIGLIFSSITVVMWQGALDVQAGRMTGGSIAAFVMTGIFVAGSFGALTEVWGDLLRGSGAAQRLSELLAETPGIAAPAEPTNFPVPARGAVTFEGVKFRYPTRPDVSALHDFSLEVAAGETVALVGPSGAGKTTVFQLIQRFYDPAAGRVAVDGIDLRTADPEALRARIAVVPQETVIFAATARDNLRYGRWDAADDALWDAAEAANAAEFLRDLPDGLGTFLGEGGARLSGGQRQRIAIARALLRDAPILLLDEATSALDASSERLVQSALERLMTDRTTLVIAHRLATVRAADRIVVMDGGRIVEAGTHRELEASGGLYARLAGLQFGGSVG